MIDETVERIRNVLDESAGLGVPASDLELNADLYAAGLTSRAAVNVMLALEGAFDLEFPDEMLQRSVFESIAAIRDAVLKLTSV